MWASWNIIIAWDGHYGLSCAWVRLGTEAMVIFSLGSRLSLVYV